MEKSLHKKIIVTTLGTGTPILNPKRASQSILVEAAGHRLLFDTGRNIATRLVQAKVKPSSVKQVFFTHFHSDHTVGFADFWLSSWKNIEFKQGTILQAIFCCILRITIWIKHVYIQMPTKFY